MYMIFIYRTHFTFRKFLQDNFSPPDDSVINRHYHNYKRVDTVLYMRLTAMIIVELTTGNTLQGIHTESKRIIFHQYKYDSFIYIQ